MEKDELEEAYAALRWVYEHGVVPAPERPQWVSNVFNEAFASYRIARSHINKEGRGMNECSIGVGDGSGQLFVRGSYEAVKHVQSIIFELEVLRARQAREEHP